MCVVNGVGDGFLGIVDKVCVSVFIIVLSIG